MHRVVETAVHLHGGLGVDEPFPTTLGQVEPGVVSEPLALSQLLLLYHLIQARQR